ncbi:Gag-Pol polyprotein [Gossypium australe]|uniref:Gag-Pol polyprotein n=1 Tax=Gossypium australe TaxID=47621 RepID=A0A5B6VC64_9ROSI|nr:Gag-Pol polyprotein [Gossypium australe]
MSITEYEREFVRLSQYARECVSTEAIMSEAVGKDKTKAEFEARDVRKRFLSKTFHSASKKFRDEQRHSKVNVGHSNRDRARSQSNSKTPATSMASVGNV